MQCKKSYFEPTLAKHDLRRFWPLPVTIMLLFALIMLSSFSSAMPKDLDLTAMVEVTGGDQPIRWHTFASRSAVYDTGIFVTTIQIFTALVSALLVMHHIHGRKQLQFYHGLPLSRRCLYITSTVTGYGMGLIPVLLVELVMMFMNLGNGGEALPSVQLMGLTAASYTIYYAIGILACVLAGQTLGGVILYWGMNCFVVAIMSGGAGIARWILYGYNDSVLMEQVTQWLTPISYIQSVASPVYDQRGMPCGYSALPLVIYSIAGLLLLLLGGFLYQLRRGETAGEMISFPVIRSICKVLVALMSGLGGAMVVGSMMSLQQDLSFLSIAVMILVMLILGWFAAEMVIQKSFRVFGKRSVGQCLSLCALMLLLLVGAKLDIINYVNYTPDLTQVSQVQMSMYGTTVDMEPSDGLHLHQLMLAHQDELSNNTSYCNNYRIQMDYLDLQGDLLVSRTYYVLETEDGQIYDGMTELLDKKDYVYQSWFSGWEQEVTESNVWTVQVYSDSYWTEKNQESIYYLQFEDQPAGQWSEQLTEEQGVILYNAIVQDIRDGNLRSYFRSGQETQTIYGQIELSLLLSPYVEDGEVATRYYNISLNASMEHTLEALKEMHVTVNSEAIQ